MTDAAQRAIRAIFDEYEVYPKGYNEAIFAELDKILGKQDDIVTAILRARLNTWLANQNTLEP